MEFRAGRATGRRRSEPAVFVCKLPKRICRPGLYRQRFRLPIIPLVPKRTIPEKFVSQDNLWRVTQRPPAVENRIATQFVVEELNELPNAVYVHDRAIVAFLPVKRE